MLVPAALGSLQSFLLGLAGASWEAVDRRIEREFPGTPFVSAGELAARYGADPSRMPAVIDARRPEEFRISRLPGALNLESAAAAAARFPDRGAPLVVYCSVGLRSARVAAGLRALGYARVENLRRGIFGWAAEGRPMVDADGGTGRVHPYNRLWGALAGPAPRARR